MTERAAYTLARMIREEFYRQPEHLNIDGMPDVTAAAWIKVLTAFTSSIESNLRIRIGWDGHPDTWPTRWGDVPSMPTWKDAASHIAQPLLDYSEGFRRQWKAEVDLCHKLCPGHPEKVWGDSEDHPVGHPRLSPGPGKAAGHLHVSLALFCYGWAQRIGLVPLGTNNNAAEGQAISRAFIQLGSALRDIFRMFMLPLPLPKEPETIRLSFNPDKAPKFKEEDLKPFDFTGALLRKQAEEHQRREDEAIMAQIEQAEKEKKFQEEHRELLKSLLKRGYKLVPQETWLEEYHQKMLNSGFIRGECLPGKHPR